MGGRGGSSGMNHSDLQLSNNEIDKLIDSAIDFIRKQPNVYGTLTKGLESEYRKEIKQAYQKGFSGLADGTILDRNPKNRNNYVVKENGGAAMYKFTPNSKQTHVITDMEKQYSRHGAIGGMGGVVVGDKGNKIKDISLNLDKKRGYTRRAILLKLIPGRG